LHIKAVQGRNDGICIRGLPKIGKGETPERARLIQVVIECIRGWNGQGSDDVQKSLAFDIKRDVFDDNGRGYNLVVRNLIGSGNTWGSIDVWERRRASTRRQIRIIRRRHRAIVRIGSTAIEPLGREASTSGLGLERGLVHAERLERRLTGRKRRRSSKVVRGSDVAGTGAVVVVSIVQTLMGWLRRE